MNRNTWLKGPYKKNYDEATTLYYKKIFKLSVMLSKKNERLERSNLALKNNFQFV